MEIGSIYEINPDSVARAMAGTAGQIELKETKKYGKSHIAFTASGREAIAFALRNLERRQGIAKRCLLPAYMCDTVFFPFENAGWEIYFYHVDKKLAADADKLRIQAERIKPGLIFIHPYYGIDTWKPMRGLLAEWKKQGICIMEDVTQSYYLDNVGKEADYVVGSLRKWYPVPDGGFLAADEIISDEELKPNTEFVEKRLELLTEKWEYLHGHGNAESRRRLKADYLQKNRQMEQWLDNHKGICALSDEAAGILMAEDEMRCSEQRKENCEYLYKKLSGMKQFVPVFCEECYEWDTEAENVTTPAPLYFPIYVNNREDLQSFLSSNDIYAPVLWPIGRENEDILTQDERYIFEHILALPIDQRYGIMEMQRITDVLEQYDKQGGNKMHDEQNSIVGIRVDANETVAMGHVMRCITIARQLAHKGCRVIFFTADEYAHGLIAQAGFKAVCLNTKWNDMEAELPKLREALQKAECKKLLVDSYQAVPEYFSGLKDICRLIYIDDCFDAVYPADIIINYNAYHVRFPYKEAYEKAYAGKTELLLGTDYVPLREEFSPDLETAADNSDDGIHVLLSSGGGDICDALTGILQKAMLDETLAGMIFHVVVGGFSQNYDKLKLLADKYPNIMLYNNVNNMAELMRKCQAAVSAAGTMLFELSAVRVPTVFFVSADNQRYDSEFFAQNEIMLFAGDIRKDRTACIENICGGLKSIIEDRELQERMRKKMREVADGRGAMRIADSICRL
ncbi:MAG: UDP-2,4-diacetamido-2,4,6-trideoxy-beta-L-altropyranose hydrolase [Butyrivibrio sp.]|nr:UDP-2,4-diacetamido-2,4,6-trideoxy-beta-L-altropyranose hydrolase [Butyrivibrio sp.]